MSLALVIEKLTIEELPRARPPVYLRGLINWQDDARCRWRSFLENLYNLINEALPNQNKLPQLAPWKFTPSPQLGAGDDFLCPLCGEIVKEIDEICRGCGASWPHKLNQ